MNESDGIVVNLFWEAMGGGEAVVEITWHHAGEGICFYYSSD